MSKAKTEYVQPSLFDTSGVEMFDYRGYEQRVSYDVQEHRWKCLTCEPAFTMTWLDFHSWEYADTRDAVVAKAKARVDAALDCVGVADRADWNAKYKAGEINTNIWVRARYPQNYPNEPRAS